METKKIKREAWLDLLRFLSACIVLAAHLLDKQVREFGILDFKENIITYLFHTGGVGVCIFFLISGYIIPSTLEQYKSAKVFLINRFFRLFPLFLLFVAIHKIKHHETSLLGILLPFANFFKTQAILGVDWTLRIECMYYLIICYIAYYWKLNEKNLLIANILIFSMGIFYFIFFPEYKFLIRSCVYINYIILGSFFFLIKKANSRKAFLSIKFLICLILIPFFLVFI